MITCFRWIVISVGLLVGATASSGAAPTFQKPNIVFILADDLGIGNIGCYGSDRFKTPNIDRLAQEGIRYTRAFVTPLCGPTRALVMTGRYGFRTGAVNQDRTGLIKPGDETFMPGILKTAGYVTSAVGKWGQLPLGPAEFGFDDYLKFTASGVYWNTQDRGKTYLVNGQTRPLEDRQYMPDQMHRHVANFINKHRDRPFYIYYSLSHIHAEILPTPDSAPDSKDLYVDNVAYMDKLVGQLVGELERQKLREKTLVVFVGDNGTVPKQAGQASIGGRRIVGDKGSMLEGGALVPMIVNWPGVIRPGQVSGDLLDGSDFVPTFAELAGAALPSKTVIDGRSFAARWRGGKDQPRQWAFCQLARMWYVREAGWKLNQAGELFDMSEAPFVEKPVPPGTTDSAAIAARNRMQAVLDKLNPAGGILDDGDGTGRHARNSRKAKSRPNSTNQRE